MTSRHLKTKILAFIVLVVSASFALADPAGRVGRIAFVQGDVVFRNMANDDSMAAQINWPVTSDNLIETGRNARAEIRVGSAAVRIDADSELEVTQLDDQRFDLRLIYGSAYVRIKNPELAHEFTLFTPQGRVLLSGPSRIRIDTERAPDTTVLSVLDGTARFAGEDSTFSVHAGKRAAISNGDVHMTTLRPNDMQDSFDRWASARDRRDDRSQSVRYVSSETTGYEELDNYGSWQTTSEYGALWTPRAVASDWAPYRVGRWAWVEPWGWTWVDNAPWGYAPFHYGRWVWFHQRWCWAPGAVVARPVWAPAMVGWVGGAHWNAAFSIGTAPAVGWFPLAPREVFVPSYRVSPTYLRQVNLTHVTNITNVTVINGIASAPAHPRYKNFRIPNAVSVVPHNRFIENRTVVVSPPPARINPRRHLESAPVSAVMPATIAHPNRLDRHSDNTSIAPPRTRFAPGPQRRFEQHPPQSAPPSMSTPPNIQREIIRRPEAIIDRRIAPPAMREPAITPPIPPAVGNPEFMRRPHVRSDRHDTPPAATPPAIAPPAREIRRGMPESSSRQDAEREHARRVHEAQVQAATQARALREQQRALQPPQMPLQQMAPRGLHEGQRIPAPRAPEKAPAELRREEHPAHPASGRERNEGRHRLDPRRIVEGR